GGDRDRLKRPLMGAAVDRFSDAAIITSDNPRGEKLEEIIQEVALGFRSGKEFSKIVDRKEAIAKALSEAQEGDCVLIAGKGHEAYQEAAGVKHPFDDRKIVREFFNGV
ncbi:MAG: UDP-N-acetylmuramoyl-L-alanyl-D-glutamate--2,6-diaminopimelate ligase, partial [Deltaproteobacteria bacterium]|nr:UDP-N-acetylmuramoyl-L-alanyl-D-glutamate--2,6-diaminopimelate ligase [Deltaproteobacteria bacterium]